MSGPEVDVREPRSGDGGCGRTILVVSEQGIVRSGNQVLPQAVLAYFRAGFRVVLLIRDWDETEMADPASFFGEWSGRLRVVKVRPLADSIRRLIRIAGLRRERISSATSPEKPISAQAAQEVLYPPPEEVVPFASTYHSWLPLSFAGFLEWVCTATLRGLPIVFQERVNLVCGFETHGAPIARILAWLLRVPLVTKYQGTFLAEHLSSRWRMFRHFPAHYLATALPADLVVMEEDGTKGREVLLRLGHPPDRIRCWMAGWKKNTATLDSERQKILGRYGVPADPQPKVILALSRLSLWKRLDRAVSAMPLVIREVPNACLLVTHRGTERERLEQLARQLGVEHRVIFTGPVPHDEVRSLLEACDVFLNVQDHSNLTNSLLEALECGKPVVTIDDRSTGDLLQHDENSLLVPLERIGNELPRALVRILTDDALRERLGKGARNVAESRLLSWEGRMALEMEEVLKLLGDEREVSARTGAGMEL